MLLNYFFPLCHTVSVAAIRPNKLGRNSSGRRRRQFQQADDGNRRRI